MPDDRRPSALGRHGLGPHVVGTRVVVRYLVRGETGPSGGPALTDVLGTCTAWDDEALELRPDPPRGQDGSPETPVPSVLRVPLADVVSGKPVPPRPSPRGRVSPAEAQRRAMALFPELETEPLGDWVLRRSPARSARRANSVLAAHEPATTGLDDHEAFRAVVGFYERHGQRPIAAVLPGTPSQALFVSHGWVPESGDADTVFQLASVARVSRSLRTLATPEVEAEVEQDGGLLTARVGDRASGVAAVDGDWVGFRSIEVAPEHRRGGLALAVMAGLVERAAEQGATTGYLQVLADNAPALGLYERLGFTEHHRYRYLAAPR